jgi:hypothetical protein
MANANTTLNFGQRLTLKQIAQVVKAVPENVHFIEGEPGIGKSSLLDTYKNDPAMSHYLIPPPIDAQSLDLGDIAMPVVNREEMVTNYAPNARFMIQQAIAQDRPVVLMLDEFTKAATPVQNMLHPLFEVKRRLGDLYLPEGSIVFATGNLSGDGVGDNLKAHTRNRLVVIEAAKPAADELIHWGVETGRIDGVVLAFMRQFPQVLASYRDGGQDDNPYIFSPRKVQTAYFSPRSAERASRIVAVRSHFDTDTLIAALKGCIGEAAARDLEAFIAYQDQLPSWDSILTSPSSAPVPDSPGACAVLVYGAVTKVTKEAMTPLMRYLERFEPEWQAAFALTLAKSQAKQPIAFSSIAFRDWLAKNQDLL